ncbi:MAG: hypothetical protein JWP58_25 [Hymenobacter sp.]|nr:hypothetical protein [Hymenobacter sp.]
MLRWCLALLLPACTEPYSPAPISSPPNYLVVDGFINPLGMTTIRLSRTYAIASKAAPPAETRATVYIEDDGGARYPLRETVAGTYASASALVLNTTRKYRLHLNTQGGKEYASDYVPAKITPPIDAVNWRAESTGLDIYVNAHDAANATQYYRWEYAETWEIRSPYSPSVEYVNGAMRPIAVPFPGVCWGNAASSAVQIDKTTALSQDVVANYRLRRLPPSSELLYSRYSILVQQYALTKEEYAYWELLRKNTESIGSLFDPQPAQLTGNVRSLSSSADLALGFVGVHSRTEKRIFISRQDLPGTWRLLSGYEGCLPPDTISLYPPVPRPPLPADILRGAFGSPDYIPVDPYTGASGRVDGYTAKSRGCIDCRTRGTSVKPSYWP